VSYSGIIQVLCEAGHYFEYDCFDPNQPSQSGIDSHSWSCPVCGNNVAWINNVDQTNEKECGRVKLKVLTKEKYCDCPSCGNHHVSNPATYRIPKKRF
jgi:predicted RNA-binding Zn-ribbon protein involved in translation (DUF1610 family)